MIFEVKQHNLRKKARLVAGGHVITADMYDSYSPVIQAITAIIMEKITINEGLNIITGDIGNTFLYAYTQEKVYTKAGPEFGEKQGYIIFI